MSLRKTRLIQERNILLEKKYILEQAPPVPGQEGQTSPAPGQGVQTPPPVENTQKFKTEDIKKNIIEKRFCSKQPQKIDTTKNEKKEIVIDGKKYNYYLTIDKNNILCVAEIKT
jgi:hypothetical protein